MKCLLGVRNTTPSLLCLVEVGLNTCQGEILKKRKSFLRSKFNNIDYDEPFHVVYDLCRRENTPGFRMLSRCLEGEIEGVTMEQLKQQIRNKPISSTKFSTYCGKLNPNLELHEIYKKNVYIPDFLRVSFSRLRLMSHSLKIETGRWSRLPREDRICICNRDVVQDECHALLECPLSLHIRDRYNQLDFTSVENLLNEKFYLLELCKYIHEVMKLFSG